VDGARFDVIAISSSVIYCAGRTITKTSLQFNGMPTNALFHAERHGGAAASDSVVTLLAQFNE
jgi:hypothetical protein